MKLEICQLNQEKKAYVSAASRMMRRRIQYTCIVRIIPGLTKYGKMQDGTRRSAVSRRGEVESEKCLVKVPHDFATTKDE